MREIDDIIVLDGGSTDGTMELIRGALNCRVFPQDPRYLDTEGYITHFSAIRNMGYALAKHPWILCVDADERATPELLSEVRRILGEGKPGVYYVRRVFYYRGKPVVSFSWSTGDHVRLFHLSCVQGCVKPVHEKLKILPGAPKGFLHAPVYVPLPDIASVRRKYDRFLKIEVQANVGITFQWWLRYIFFRNLLAIARRPLVAIMVRLLPRRGPRMPLAYEWEQMRYSWLVLIRTCPLWRSGKPDNR